MTTDAAQVASSDRGRRSAPGVEEIEVRTQDGWSLRTDVHEPAGTPVGTAVLAHAFMARRSEFDRPRGTGFASFLVGRGWRVVAFDFRAHGDSGPAAHEGGVYGYDDLVARDLPSVCAFARSRGRVKTPLIVVGHSLGGHVALAAQGTGAIAVDAIVGFGASPWLPQLEPSRARWLVKRAVLAASVAIARQNGRFPSRSLGVGSDDEPRSSVEDFARFARTGRWTSADGGVDYMASLASVRIPLLGVVSEGDRLECPPACGERLLDLTAGTHDFVRVDRRDDGSRAPGHMGLVTGGSMGRAWTEVEGWMRNVPRLNTPYGPPGGRSSPG
jgi:predicted alpha/beta hydrolase